jgi:pimeloyl-ACP methyl ester carboxylesterase
LEDGGRARRGREGAGHERARRGRLHAAAGGDLKPLAGQFLLYDRSLEEQIAYGMHTAVVCTEDAPRFAAHSPSAGGPDRPESAELEQLRALCRPWSAGVRDADLDAPLRASVPALLLSGEADPVTPPAGGARAASGFGEARHLVLAGQGHGQLGTGCVPELMDVFLSVHRAKDLATTCVERVRPAPFFIDYAGPAP